MTVKELIERLGEFPPDALVYTEQDTYPALPLLVVAEANPDRHLGLLTEEDMHLHDFVILASCEHWEPA